MSPTSYDPVVDTSVHDVSLERHGGFIEQTSLQVHPKGLPWGNIDIILPSQEFDVTCKWLEQHTLIGYSIGRTPPNAMLREWVFGNGPWSVPSPLLVFQRWSRDFIVSDEKKT